MSETVAVIGASHKKERYSYQAMELLIEKGHQVVPISPLGREILGRQGFKRLTDFSGPVDTVTMYVGPARQTEVMNDILTCKPARVIFNPGTESEESFRILEAAEIEYQIECTLIMLGSNEF